MNFRWRRSLLWLLYFGLLTAGVTACAASNSARTPAPIKAASNAEKAAVNSMPVIHVFVALADNVNQGIVPVSASLGNGDNPTTNLYWGAAFGVRTFFSRNKEWELLSVARNPTTTILERCVFKHRRTFIPVGCRRLSRQRDRTNDLGFSGSGWRQTGREAKDW